MSLSAHLHGFIHDQRWESDEINIIAKQFNINWAVGTLNNVNGWHK